VLLYFSTLFIFLFGNYLFRHLLFFSSVLWCSLSELCDDDPLVRNPMVKSRRQYEEALARGPSGLSIGRVVAVSSHSSVTKDVNNIASPTMMTRPLLLQSSTIRHSPASRSSINPLDSSSSPASASGGSTPTSRPSSSYYAQYPQQPSAAGAPKRPRLCLNEHHQQSPAESPANSDASACVANDDDEYFEGPSVGDADLTAPVFTTLTAVIVQPQNLTGSADDQGHENVFNEM
jgi:hypothetical protein